MKKKLQLKTAGQIADFMESLSDYDLKKLRIGWTDVQIKGVRLRPLGNGISRRTYSIAGNKRFVVKVQMAAYDEWGQNEREYAIWQRVEKGMVANIYYYDPNFRWMVVDRATHVRFYRDPFDAIINGANSKTFEKLLKLGVTEVREFGKVNGKMVCIDYGYCSYFKRLKVY